MLDPNPGMSILKPSASKPEVEDPKEAKGSERMRQRRSLGLVSLRVSGGFGILLFCLFWGSTECVEGLAALLGRVVSRSQRRYTGKVRRSIAFPQLEFRAYSFAEA